VSYHSGKGLGEGKREGGGEREVGEMKSGVGYTDQIITVKEIGGSNYTL